MRLIFCIFALLFLFCSSRMEDQDVKDYGMKQVGDNIYIKKLMVGNDRIYFLVDRDGKLISTNTSTTYTTNTGKVTTTHTESNTLINQ